MYTHQTTEVLVEQLSEIIEERKKGYQKASEKISDPYLKALFQSHSNFCDIILKDLPPNGDDIVLNFSSHAHSNKWKYWGDIKTALKSGARLDLLEACIKGDQQIIYLYQEILEDPLLPSDLRQKLNKYILEIKKTCENLKIFKISL